MKEIIAMHGWAGDSHQWSHWEKIFKSCDWEWQTFERGYKDIRPHTPKWNLNSNQSELIINNITNTVELIIPKSK